MRIRKGTVALGVSGLLASVLLTGCTPDGDVVDADYAQVCRDSKTELRVEDDKCSDQGRSSGAYGWYFYHMASGSSSVPPVGSKATGGVTSVPQGASSKPGVSGKGGTVSRGGFGGSAKGGSTTGG